MSRPDDPSCPPERQFVVAIEYAGADLPATVGGSRRPLLEHAYEVRSGLLLAHPRREPRVAFPDPGRGWPSAPRLTRCGTCTLAVTDLVRDILMELFTGVRECVTWWFSDASADLVRLYPSIRLP